jgi:hypothetical protein
MMFVGCGGSSGSGNVSVVDDGGSATGAVLPNGAYYDEENDSEYIDILTISGNKIELSELYLDGDPSEQYISFGTYSLDGNEMTVKFTREEYYLGGVLKTQNSVNRTFEVEYNLDEDILEIIFEDGDSFKYILRK